MGSRVTVAGVAGTLRWGYHEAATVTDWALTKTDDGWALAATVVTADTWRLSQRPLVFVAPHATGAWRWPVRELQITGASLRATLGPKES